MARHHDVSGVMDLLCRGGSQPTPSAVWMRGRSLVLWLILGQWRSGRAFSPVAAGRGGRGARERRHTSDASVTSCRPFARRARAKWLRNPAYATMYSSRIQRSAKQLASHDPSTASSDVPFGAPSKHVVVVGGGVGGLAVACRLIARSRDRMAKHNRRQDDDDHHPHVPNQWKVTVLEKNDEVGGRCGSFFVDVPGRGTFRHERGPSLLLLPDAYRELFQECGSSMAQCGLELRECSPAYQVVFDDGDRVNLGFRRTCTQKESNTPDYSEMEIESRRALDVMEPNGAEKWDEYLRTCEAYLECGLPNFIEQRLDLASLPEFLYESLRDNAKAWPLQPHSSMLDKFFASNKLRALASFQDLYVGLEPYRNEDEVAGGVLTSTAPAIFGLLVAIEMHPTNARCGVSAPVGGFDAVTRAMAALAHDLGVDVQCGKTVTKVANDGVHVVNTSPLSNGGGTDDDGANGPDFIPADLVVVNADLPYARQSLMKPDCDPDQAVYDWSTGDPGQPRYRFSSGVVAFHWSISRELNDLNTHNVFLGASKRTEAELSWRVVRDSNSATGNVGETPPSGPASVEPFNFYVHRASKTDPTAAPKVRAQYWMC
jgi:phytoene dehydrogenase-like protein